LPLDRRTANMLEGRLVARVGPGVRPDPRLLPSSRRKPICATSSRSDLWILPMAPPPGNCSCQRCRDCSALTPVPQFRNFRRGGGCLPSRPRHAQMPCIWGPPSAQAKFCRPFSPRASTKNVEPFLLPFPLYGVTRDVPRSCGRVASIREENDDDETSFAAEG
jgi:hypothetical protein